MLAIKSVPTVQKIFMPQAWDGKPRKPRRCLAHRTERRFHLHLCPLLANSLARDDIIGALRNDQNRVLRHQTQRWWNVRPPNYESGGTDLRWLTLQPFQRVHETNTQFKGFSVYIWAWDADLDGPWLPTLLAKPQARTKLKFKTWFYHTPINASSRISEPSYN